MTYQEFLYKWNGKPCDFDGYYGNQCVDLANQYNQDVIGAPRLTGNAKDIWDTYPKDKYDRITNTPTGVPQKGDLVIWGAMPGNSYGHIGIFDNGNVNTFISFDENFPAGSYSHLQNHNYNYVLGWLHPKNQSTIDWSMKVDQVHNAISTGETAEVKIQNVKKIVNT